MEERRALLLRGKGAGTDPAGQTDGEALTDGQMVDKKSKLTKPERRKELKEQRRKDKENKKREASAAQQAGKPEQDDGQVHGDLVLYNLVKCCHECLLRGFYDNCQGAVSSEFTSGVATQFLACDGCW